MKTRKTTFLILPVLWAITLSNFGCNDTNGSKGAATGTAANMPGAVNGTDDTGGSGDSGSMDSSHAGSLHYGTDSSNSAAPNADQQLLSDFEESDEACSDGIDNDGDGFIDCEDRDCTINPYITVCPHSENDCTNGIDDDADGFIDASDWDCKGAESSDEACADRADNDGDGYIDCDDYDCSRNPEVTVCNDSGTTSTENDDTACDDGQDNDGDGHIDCDDYDCSRNPDITVCECDADTPSGFCPEGSVCSLGECVEEGTLVCGAEHPDGHCPTGFTCAGEAGCLPPFMLPCSQQWPEGMCSGEQQVCDEGLCRDLGSCGSEEPSGICSDADAACVSGECITATAPTQVGELVITEVMVNPSFVSDASGEWFEVYNTTAHPILLDDVKLEDNRESPISVGQGPHVIPPGGYMVFGTNIDQSTNGGIPVDIAYASSDIQLSNRGDYIRLTIDKTDGENTVNLVIDEVRFGDTLPVPNGASLSLDPSVLAQDVVDQAWQANDDPANWCDGTIPTGVDISSDLGTPGRPNPPCAR